MPNLNVSSSDWDSVSAESQSAIAGIISNHFGMNVVASGGGVPLSGDMSSYQADADSSTSEGELDTSVVEASAGDVARELAKQAARALCKKACTTAQEEGMAECLLLAETGIGVAICEAAVALAGHYCRKACDDEIN